MGQVVPFIARVRDSGDWSASERTRLEELADRLAASGVKVEVVFGATDEGDPWCVVTDGNGDVLIHVARIDGVFVVHSAVDDTVSEGSDLHAALRDRLAATEEMAAPHSAVVLPFGLTARQGQTFLALVAATAFFYETSGGVDTAEAAEIPHPPAPADDPPPAPATDTGTTSHERQLANQSGVLQDPDADKPQAVALAVVEAPTPHQVIAAEPVEAQPAPPLAAPAQPTLHPPAVLPTPEAEPAPVVIKGTAGDDLLVGTAANEHILGGAGADTLQGGGGHDTLDGGAGDDRIELGAGVVAVGGQGADTFVVQAPHEFGHPDKLLGVILDFNGTDGDRVITWRGDAIKLPPHPLTDAKTAAPNGDGVFRNEMGFGTATVSPPQLAHVDVDLNGDGQADGYLLVGDGGHTAGGDDHPIVVTGKSLQDGDFLG